MQYVLRIAHPETGLGPYFHSPESFDSLPMEYSPALPIRVDAISPEVVNDAYVCGVEYMSQLYDWFGDSLDYLSDQGFRLYMYLLPAHTVIRTRSRMQVAFNPKDALQVEEVA